MYAGLYILVAEMNEDGTSIRVSTSVGALLKDHGTENPINLGTVGSLAGVRRTFPPGEGQTIPVNYHMAARHSG